MIWKQMLGLGLYNDAGSGGGGGNNAGGAAGAGGSGDSGTGGQANGGQGDTTGSGGSGSGGDAGAGGAGGGAGSPAWHENVGWFEALPEGMKGSAASLEAFKGKPIGEVLAGLSQRIAEAAPPASPKEYQVEIPARPDGSAIDPKELEPFLVMAHGAGYNTKQVQAMLDHTAAVAKAEFEAGKKAADDAGAELKQKWGDRYPQNIALVERVVAALPDATKKLLDESGVGSHPHIIELIYQVGEARAEGRMAQGDTSGARKPTSEVLYGSAR